MPSSTETGVKANQYGRTQSRKIAQHFNASNLRDFSNECTINGATVVVKYARVKTNSVGLSYAMLPRITVILAAFKDGQGSFDCYLLSVATAKQFMRPRTGKLAGKMGLVEKSVFVSKGQVLGQVV